MSTCDYITAKRVRLKIKKKSQRTSRVCVCVTVCMCVCDRERERERRPSDEGAQNQPGTCPTKRKQNTITQVFASITPYDNSSRRHREITDAITNYLAKGMVPIYTVEKEGFRKMIRTLDRRYELRLKYTSASRLRRPYGVGYPRRRREPFILLRRPMRRFFCRGAIHRLAVFIITR